ncbi:MAG: hypothetical protein ACE5FW_00995, partial [Candidatus Aenigmatarchaeota archaeon]
VTAYITRYVRIGSDLYVRYQYTGSDTNPPVVVLGDTTDPNLKIPLSAFDPPNAVLTVSDGFTLDKTFANEGQLRFTRATGGSYDFTVMIPGKGVFLNDTTIRSVASFGTKLSEGILHTEVVDADAPTASTLTIEPSGGKLTHGDSIWARAYATDPDTGQQTWEGYVAFCEVRITGPGGFDYASNASNCKYSRPVYSSGTYTVYVTPYDRTGNAGATISSSQPISVAPKITQHISDLSMVWHKNQAGFDAIESGVTAKFQTSTNESYSFPTCIATYFNGTDGSFIQTSTIATTPDTDGSGSVTCRITGKLPAPIAQNDGVYWVTINATDSQGYTLQTIPHIFYVCNSLASSGTGWDCAYADFDQDGYTEGVLQPFNYSGTYYVCDNCPDIYNPDQKDANGNGVGDACEVLNYPPDTIEMVLNSTHGTDYPDEDLFCYARGTDVESPNLTAYWRWHKDGVLNLSGSTNVTNDTFELITTLGSGNTSAGETWSCSILMFDGELNETAWNTRSLTILAPPIVGTIGIRLTLPDNTHTVYVPGMGELSPTSDGGWDSAPHWFIASHKDNNLYALVHNYQTPVSLGLTHTGQNHTIILVQNLTNSHAFVVFSEGDQAAIENRMPLIEGHEFLKKISPSFAYGLGLLHPIKVLLESAIDLQNDLILHEGLHEVLFEYNQSPAGDPAVAFSRTG